MKTQVYVIHDITAGIYTTPFYALNNQTALRTFAGVVNEPGSTIYQKPGDFRLYRIGSYEDTDASLEIYKDLEYIGHGIDFKIHPQKPLDIEVK